MRTLKACQSLKYVYPVHGKGYNTMSFTESIKTCLSKYADFSGRASRSEYWFQNLGEFSEIRLHHYLCS